MARSRQRPLKASTAVGMVTILEHHLRMSCIWPSIFLIIVRHHRAVALLRNYMAMAALIMAHENALAFANARRRCRPKPEACCRGIIRKSLYLVPRGYRQAALERKKELSRRRGNGKKCAVGNRKRAHVAVNSETVMSNRANGLMVEAHRRHQRLYWGGDCPKTSCWRPGDGNLSLCTGGIVGRRPALREARAFYMLTMTGDGDKMSFLLRIVWLHAESGKYRRAATAAPNTHAGERRCARHAGMSARAARGRRPTPASCWHAIRLAAPAGNAGCSAAIACITSIRIVSPASYHAFRRRLAMRTAGARTAHWLTDDVEARNKCMGMRAKPMYRPVRRKAKIAIWSKRRASWNLGSMAEMASRMKASSSSLSS